MTVNVSEQWEGFVRFMELSADKSLVSLLRNSVLLEMSQQSLAIGLQNSGLFSEEKRQQIEIAAQQFFKRQITIRYEDSMDGIDDSVRVKLEQEREEKEKEEQRKAAEGDNVRQILSIFPQSKIKSIKIIEEKKDV